ncbi:hypothetical protein TNCV_3898031 [Trichonephila clavipes]|nr:hypothetical protein TNCV_3898031 [Trichonephila clavipes]
MSGERGGQATSPPRLIHLPVYVSWMRLRTITEKYAGTLLCMNHMFWCAVVGTPCHAPTPDEKLDIFICTGFFSCTGYCSKYLHLLGHFPRLANPPPDDYCYCDFYRLIVICDPMFCGDFSSPYCLLPPL